MLDLRVDDAVHGGGGHVAHARHLQAVPREPFVEEATRHDVGGDGWRAPLEEELLRLKVVQPVAEREPPPILDQRGELGLAAYLEVVHDVLKIAAHLQRRPEGLQVRLGAQVHHHGRNVGRVAAPRHLPPRVRGHGDDALSRYGHAHRALLVAPPIVSAVPPLRQPLQHVHQQALELLEVLRGAVEELALRPLGRARVEAWHELAAGEEERTQRAVGAPHGRHHGAKVVRVAAQVVGGGIGVVVVAEPSVTTARARRGGRVGPATAHGGVASLGTRLDIRVAALHEMVPDKRRAQALPPHLFTVEHVVQLRQPRGAVRPLVAKGDAVVAGRAEQRCQLARVDLLVDGRLLAIVFPLANANAFVHELAKVHQPRVLHVGHGRDEGSLRPGVLGAVGRPEQRSEP